MQKFVDVRSVSPSSSRVKSALRPYFMHHVMEAKENHSMASGQLEYGARQHDDSENGVEMVDYMLSNPPPPPPPQTQTSFDKLSLADVMQFADFGPKLALNHSSKANSDDESYFLKFHLGDKLQEEPLAGPSSPPLPRRPPAPTSCVENDKNKGLGAASAAENPSSVQMPLSSSDGADKAGVVAETKPRRKRPRSMKTSEEVESQRMTHIAVERNRRRQMNEHLRVLRSLMPGSYVQRGDQASIIGGAIEFVRELEQLLQCLESQKRRRLLGNGEGPALPGLPQQQQQAPFYHPLDPSDGDRSVQLMQEVDPSGGLREEIAENKSVLADIEVRLLGSDAMIKILSRRRPGQLIKTIAALEDLQFNILHTNVTTVEQTVLYSFTVKIAADARCTAEDIANSVLQILSYIDANTI